MTLSLYSATVPVFLQILPSIGALVDKGATWCKDNGKPESELLQARLAEDMWPFAAQVRMVWMHSGGAVDGVRQGETGPDFSEPPATFAALRAGIDAAVATLETVRPEELDALADKAMSFRVGERSLDFHAQDYLLTFALPNFFFHATTAYAILRSRGLDIGKRDFLGGVRLKT